METIDHVKHQSVLPFFNFESDFIENNIRCIPMIVRMKLDLVGVKLSLRQWSTFSIQERNILVLKPCNSNVQRNKYIRLIKSFIEENLTDRISYIPIASQPEWLYADQIQSEVLFHVHSLGLRLDLENWKALDDLQRFALIKLSRPGHENKNFKKAFKEFGLTTDL